MELLPWSLPFSCESETKLNLYSKQEEEDDGYLKIPSPLVFVKSTAPCYMYNQSCF